MADSTTNSEVNPYQAPQATADSKLPFDTQFLVSETCVACEDNLELPPVCIVTGETTDVSQLSKRLAYYPWWLKILYIVLVICIPSGLSAVSRISPIPQAKTEVGIFISVFALLLFAAVLGTFLFRRTIDASWYIHNSQFPKRDKRRTFLGLLLGGIVGLGTIVAERSTFEIFFLPFLTFSMTGAALFKGAPPKPIFRGHHEGLNVVMGLSPEFLAQVKLIIDQHHGNSHE